MLCYMGLVSKGQSQQAYPSQQSLSTPSVQPTLTKVKHQRQKSGTVIWGVGGTNGVADAEFQNAFSTGVLSSSQWSAISISHSSGTVTPGAAYWVRNTSGIGQGSFWGSVAPFASLSQANGVALFDSDELDNAGGGISALGTGTAPAFQKGELISPTIDLSGYTDSALTLNFYLMFRNFNISELSASMSVDGGTTWTTSSILSTNPIQNSATQVELIFPNVTAGVTNLSNCRIKFTFDGNYYYAMVDDVSIKTANDLDLTIAVANAFGNGLNDEYLSVLTTDNTHVPLQQITGQGLRYGANVKNLGFENISASDSASLGVAIQKNNNGTWTTVHQQSTLIDTITAGGSGTAVLDSLSSNSWISIGDFRTVYTVNITGEADASNDTLINNFSINDNSYWSKVQLNNNGAANFTRTIFPGGTDFNRFEFGSVFSTVAGNVLVDSIDYTYNIPSIYTGNGSQIVKAYVYEWIDGAGSGTINRQIDADRLNGELTLVGIGTDSLSGLVAGAGYFNSNIIMTDTSATPGKLSLNPNTHYLVTLSLESNGTPFTANTSIWLAASDNVNYALNNAYSNGLFLTQTQVFLEDGSGGTSGFWVGFGLDVVPTFGVHISAPCASFAASTTIDSIPNFGASDGAITASTTGGTAPLTYAWSNGSTNAAISGLATGTYTVTVTDFTGCTANSSIFLAQGIPDLVINEIMYNPAESGTDSTEYIEIYNNEASAVNLEGYYFTQGVNFTFPNVSINAGDYLVVSADSSAVRNRHGVGSLQWSSGGLSNSGEDIALRDSLNRQIDSVDYDDNAPWPTGPLNPDGSGPSIELNGFNLDNNIGSNWNISSQIIAGQIVNGNQVYGTPGAANNTFQPLAVSITVDSNVTCNGFLNGGMTVTASNGLVPYSYAWSNNDTIASITGVAAGVYVVTVTDNAGNTTTLSDTITEPSAITISSTSTDESCNPGNDGTIITSVTGGTTPYSYLWSSGATTANAMNLVSGLYTVTVTDANACTATLIDTVNAAPVIINSLIASNVNCNGGSDGSINVFPSGGTIPFTYLWSTGDTTQNISSLSVGTYTVTVTDVNGCTATNTVTITEPAAITVALVTTNVSCNGGNDGSASITATGGFSPYTFLWSTGDTTANTSNLTAGNYSVTVTDVAGCDTITSFTINQPTAINDTVIRNQFTLTASQIGANYQWLDCNNGNAPITGATMQSYTVTSNGDYAVEITLNGCVDTSSCIMILNVGIDQISNPQLSLNLYPNPNKGIFNLEIGEDVPSNHPLEIYNLSGSLITTINLNSSQQQIDVTQLSNGVYFIRYKSNVKKFVINQ